MKEQTKILAALWLFQAINNMDRVALSFAGPSIMKSLSMDTKTFGMVLSSFTMGYFIAQIPGGLLADRIGSKILLVISPIFWAIFTGATGLVSGLAGFMLVRVSLGLAEGLSNSSCYKVFGEHFNSQERTRAIAIWCTAMAIGPACVGPLIGALLVHFKWQSVFQMLAIPSLIVAVTMYVFIPKRGAKTDAHVLAGIDIQTTGVDRGAARSILRDRNLWLITGAYFLYNIAFGGYLGWMPTYLASAHGIDMKSIGMLGGVAYALAFFGLLVHGWLGGRVFYRHRPQLLACSYILTAVGLIGAYRATSVWGALCGLSVTAFFLYGGLSCFGAILLELAPAQTRATYSGFCSTLGQCGGVIAPFAIGWMVNATGKFDNGFALMAISLCLAACCVLALIPAILAKARAASALVVEF
ncbi:Sugar phosphate permease [Paraburkholderia unamae]|uniref:MFS transporter n=1 Tax=Paraburkholderia unamae TaxID=219649 RepID=UPI000DC52C4D|nr:MFS transporter [Paraburkholderia unamae]RAR56402.1 sugar phosphate permease [Paraburkholderia unamae]CAG9266140.1 Sugar phosphate permease [Paraburkholderia unamae]